MEQWEKNKTYPSTHNHVVSIFENLVDIFYGRENITHIFVVDFQGDACFELLFASLITICFPTRADFI